MSDVQQAKPTIPTAGKLSVGWSIAAVLLAFGVSVGLGRQAAAGRKPASVPEEVHSAQKPLDIKPVPAPVSESKPAPKPAVPMDPSVFRIPVSISQPRLGPENPLVTIVQWCDFPDADCQSAEPAVQAILKKHPDDVNLIFRHFVRPELAGSERAHEFAQTAHQHAAKFWEARKLMLGHKGELSDKDFERIAKKLKLDWSAAKRDMDSKTHEAHIAADRVFATMFDVGTTPSFFANGRPLAGPPSELDALVTQELARAKKLVETGVPRAEVYTQLTKNGTWKPPPKAVRRP